MSDILKKFPIEKVRSQFPALKRTHNNRQVTYFDGPGGAQTVKSAIDTVCRYLSSGCANLHGHFPTSIETEALILKSREAVAALFNAKPNEVAFGPNATTMMFHVARAISKTWNQGDEILLTELEHHSNIDAWRTAAEDRKVTVKYIPLDTKKLTLDLSNLSSLITPQTKFVAVGLASNCIGTINDVRAIAMAAKKVGAIVASDAVHAIPHMYVDMQYMGIDMLFSSVYKFFGPHVGMAVIREDLFKKLDIYKVAPAPGYIPDKLETGTQNHEGIPAIVDTVNFIASLGSGSSLTEKIKSGYIQIELYENALADVIRDALKGINKLTLYQADDDIPKTPTIAFRIAGIEPVDFCKRMCEEYSIFSAEGDFYARTLAEKLGISDKGAFIRVGIAPYNTIEEVQHFIKGVNAIIASIQ